MDNYSFNIIYGFVSPWPRAKELKNRLLDSGGVLSIQRIVNRFNFSWRHTPAYSLDGGAGVRGLDALADVLARG